MENLVYIKNYVDDNESDKLTLKVTKLETQIKKLNGENSQLRAKVNNLENIVEKICAQLKIQTNLNSESKPAKLEENDVEETWLYYIKKGFSNEQISKALNFGTEPVIIELKMNEWVNENKLLVDLLNSFPKFKEFSEDWSSMSNKQLVHFLQTILSSTLVSDTAIILRNLPSKTQSNYDSIMSNIATVAEIMYNTWEELEVNNELMGKMALVLESQEELQILNIIKNNTRLILFVEALFS